MNAPAAPRLTDNPRKADHPVDPMFTARHSARAFTDRAFTEADLMTILEAARWAPSGSNVQPARIVWALRGQPAFDAIAAALGNSNRIWAEKAAALLVMASKDEVERDGARVAHPSAAFDAGAAWMSLALQTHLMGWVAHAMGGYDKDKAAAAVALPSGHSTHVVIAIGQKGDPSSLPEPQRPREVPNGRSPLSAMAFAGAFPQG